jgi:2-polyprenyl-3-methyl-5-hydroxy-6-metoxy-1,4-benzoquinol methylase
MDYSFSIVYQCNMCQAPAETQKVLGKRMNQSQGMFPKRRIGVTTTIVRCKVCGLVFSNPMPIPENLQDHYGVPPDHYWQDAYFSPDPYYLKDQIESFQRLSGKTVGRDRLTALDIGAGIGKGMIALAAAGFNAYGIEPSETFYRVAVDKMGICRTKIQLAGVEEATFEPAMFDFVSFGAVLEHIPDPSAAIRKVMKLLRPGGLLHIEVPSSSWLIAKMGNVFYRVTGSDYVTNLSPMHPPYHLYEFSLASFDLNGSKNSYRVVDHRFYVCQTYMPRIVGPCLAWLMKVTNTGMQLEVWLANARG